MGEFRPKIWCGFLNKGTLSLSRGDSIGEIRLIRMLSQYSDVYYNGIKVNSQDETLGKGETLICPKDGYDMYYVRANNDLFLDLPHPKVCMAYPYDETVFRAADGLIVTTDIWKQILTDLSMRATYDAFFDKWYPKDAYIPQSIIQFKQSSDTNISTSPIKREQSATWKYKLTNTNTLGFYGRLDVSSLPYSVMAALEKIDPELRPVLAFAGLVRAELKEKMGLISKHMYLGKIDYNDMPSLIRATSCTLAGEAPDDQVLGSNKIMDSISLGVPVICKRTPVRSEYLGENYPGLFSDVDDAVECITAFVSDSGFRKKLLDETEQAAQRNTVTMAGEFTRDQLEVFLKQPMADKTNS